ncbi:hypothetical protein ACKJ8N_001515 [Vibrio cholerae]
MRPSRLHKRERFDDYEPEDNKVNKKLRRDRKATRKVKRML